MTMSVAQINPFYACRQRPTRTQVLVGADEPIRKVVIGSATLYRADCFDVLPAMSNVDAVVTDPPFGIGFAYRSCDDAPGDFEPMMRRLVPELVRVTGNGPCFVWQSPLNAPLWTSLFPEGYRMVAACKLFPKRGGKTPCLSWDPVIFWSGRSRIHDELPRDWHVSYLRPWDGYRGDNPVPCPRPLAQVRYFCDSVRADTILDPFLGSGTTGVAAILAG